MLNLAFNNYLKYLETKARVKPKIYCLSELLIIFILIILFYIYSALTDIVTL